MEEGEGTDIECYSAKDCCTYMYMEVHMRVHVLLYRYMHTCIHLRGVTNRQL